MTIVGAEAYDDGIIVWCDMLVRHERDGLQNEPIPKIAVLAPNTVVGVAGSDPQGGLGNALSLWQGSNDVQDFVSAIAEDGGTERDYLVAVDDRRLFPFEGAEQRWTDRSSSRFAWIGDSEARNALMPYGLLPPLESEDSDMAAVVSEAWALTRAGQVVRGAPAETVGGLLVTVFLDPHQGFVFRSATVVGPDSPISDALSPSHDLSTLHGVVRTLLSKGDGLAYRIQDLGGSPSAFQIGLATRSERAIVTYSLDAGGYAGRAYRVSNDELIPLHGDPPHD